MSPYEDPYARSADHLDLLSAGMWQHLTSGVTEALGDLAEHSTIVELGAGTGLGTEVIARIAPTASIVAVEPSSHLRAVLLHRIASDTDLRSRVTIENLPFPASRLPESFDALFIMNTLGHLDRQAREQLWQVIAARLRPAGYAVINLQQPTTASAVPEFEMAHERVGNRSYHGSAWAERIDDTTMKWHMTYRTSEDGTEIEATDVEYLWNVIDSTTLENELRQHNLSAAAVGSEQLGIHRIKSRA
ncbi:class I SAM-dependent methyltransferase [Rhodococcoides yunnanense]|uniref:Class I SAM-dependent methyltransferase n=1 Tax=Rhodococcoides yunnanense TaxID=278209 RepID=A0ABU4BCL7_9NOCA|nr:class I SAM-dependent methyltransferase [Rhodococcus yunnanensis]MDV6261942.1 class I SAM-dependent methyltransferase [Rhodococcus yunnanensis]